MADFVKLAETARRLVEKNGRTLSVVKDSTASVDPAKPWRERTTGADVTVSALGVVVPYDDSEIDGDHVKRGDRRIYLAATSAALVGQKIEDFNRVIDGTEVYHIVGVEVLIPGPVRLLYTIQGRK